jgi:putative effector of murein hydrolase LrgA (UPF0299 family)
LKISKYSIISFFIVYIILGYTTFFAIKYISPVDTPPQEAFIDKFVNTITHLSIGKIIIALVVAVVVNIIVNRRK